MLRNALSHMTCLLLVGSLLGLAACTPAPSAMKPSAQESAAATHSTLHQKQWRPTSIQYQGIFGGTPNVKPWFWFDADDNPAFQARIRTNPNASTANVTRTPGGTWGKVHTVAIPPDLRFDTVRVFIPHCSASVTWKLVVQEEGGTWRSWPLQASTAETGYHDYPFREILKTIQAAHTRYTLAVVVEGAPGQFIEIAELYVFEPNPPEHAAEAFWVENFAARGPYVPSGEHTAGWSDVTTHPDFHARITTLWSGFGSIVLPAEAPVEWGKVLSPELTCNPKRYPKLKLDVYAQRVDFKVALQERHGAYRHWWLNGQKDPNRASGYVYDLASVPWLTAQTPFSIEISYSRTTPQLYDLVLKSIGIYKE